MSGTYRRPLRRSGNLGRGEKYPRRDYRQLGTLTVHLRLVQHPDDKAGTHIFILEQFGTTVLGVNEDSGGAVAGTISSTGSIVLKFKGDNTGTNTATITGTINAA